MLNWKKIEDLPEEYYGNNEEILLKTFIGIVSAWYHVEHEEWVCYDDMFSLAHDDGTITHYTEIKKEGI